MLTEEQLPVYYSNIDPVGQSCTAVFTTLIKRDGVELTRIVDHQTISIDDIGYLKTKLGVETNAEIEYLEKIKIKKDVK